MAKRNCLALVAALILSLVLFFYAPVKTLADTGGFPPNPMEDTLTDSTDTSVYSAPDGEADEEGIIDMIIDFILGEE